MIFKCKGVPKKHITRKKLLPLDLVAQLSFFSQHPVLHSQPTEGGDKEEEEKEENKNLDIFASFVKCRERHLPRVGG